VVEKLKGPEMCTLRNLMLIKKKVHRHIMHQVNKSIGTVSVNLHWLLIHVT